MDEDLWKELVFFVSVFIVVCAAVVILIVAADVPR